MNKYSIGPTIEVDGAPRICIDEAGFGTVALFNVADDYSSATYEEDEQADIEKAEFFVRAVNNHDALVKALQELEFAAARYMTSNKEAAIVTAARAALAAAGIGAVASAKQEMTATEYLATLPSAGGAA